MQNTIENQGNGRDLSGESLLLRPDDQILITGASGFIGVRLVRTLLEMGFQNLCCLTRLPGKVSKFDALRNEPGGSRIRVVTGNLLSREDCATATRGAKLIYHLAAGRGEKSTPDAYMNSVVATRNLIEEGARQGCLKRFVSVSSFAVYSNRQKPCGSLLDELCPIEPRPELCGDAYSFAKIKQDEMVAECC